MSATCGARVCSRAHVSCLLLCAYSVRACVLGRKPLKYINEADGKMGAEFKVSQVRWMNFGMCEDGGVVPDGTAPTCTTHIGEVWMRTCYTSDATAEPWRHLPLFRRATQDLERPMVTPANIDTERTRCSRPQCAFSELMPLDPIKARHMFRLGKMACGNQLHLIGTWPDANGVELKAALKKKEEDKKAGKEKKQRKNKRVDVREAAFVAEVERVEENDDEEEAGDDDDEMAGEEEPGGELKEGEGSKEENVGEEDGGDEEESDDDDDDDDDDSDHD